MLLDIVRISLHHGSASKFYPCLEWTLQEFIWEITLVHLRYCQQMDTKNGICCSNNYSDNGNNVTEKHEQLFLK